MTTKLIYEILEEFKESPNKKGTLIKYAENQVFKDVLQGAFHPAIKFVFDELPEYKKVAVPAGMGYSTIYNEMGRIYLFVEGSTRVDPHLSLKRKKELLIQMLEAMEPPEAELFYNLLQKDLKIPGLTYDLVKEVFPQLLP